MVSEWDRLCVDFEGFYSYDKSLMAAFNAIKAVGDENFALMQLANSRLNEVAKQLGITQNALREISEGKGAYSRDQLIHASNCIADMKKLAVDALEATK